MAQPAHIHFIEVHPIRFGQRDVFGLDLLYISIHLVNEIEDVVSQSHAEVVLSHLQDKVF